MNKQIKYAIQSLAVTIMIIMALGLEGNPEFIMELF